MGEERLVDPLHRIVRERNRGRIGEMRNAKTRPRPLSRLFDQSTADGIAEHIPEDGEEMAVPFEWESS